MSVKQDSVEIRVSIEMDMPHLWFIIILDNSAWYL